MLHHEILDHQEEMVTDHILLQLDHQETEQDLSPDLAIDHQLHQIDFKEDQNNHQQQKENLLVDEIEVVEEKDHDLDFPVEVDNYYFK